jgi:hypothetical protein
MPSFERSATAAAPPEEVWKVLYDPARFPEWWAGIETVEVTTLPAGTGEPPPTPCIPRDTPTSRCRSSFRRHPRNNQS